MKTTIFRFSWLLSMMLAGAVMAPAALSAQRADSTRTHTVKAGDTLWNLAATYLGDSHRWREILALNPSLQSATSLPMGAAIRIPASGARAGSRDTARREMRAAPPARPQGRTGDSIRRTVFFGAQHAGGFVRQDSIRRVSVDSGVPARVFEGLSAPFVADSVALERGGRCLSVGPAGSSESGGVLLQGTLSITLPAGAVPDTQARWLLVRRGPLLPDHGVIVLPTGIVRLTSNGATGSTAEVVAQFDAMSCSDVILPAVAPPADPGGRLTPVSDGPVGRVLWVAGESVLPSLQHALILDLGSASGAKVGDRVTVYGTNNAVAASADIVRIDARTATALVVRQSLGSLATGLRVRVTEKLP